MPPKSAPFACLPFEPRGCRNPTHQPTLAACLQLKLDVIEATNGREGLLAYLRHGRDQIAFVFLDLVMPVWDGFRAALSIRRCAQTLRVHSGLQWVLRRTARSAGTERGSSGSCGCVSPRRMCPLLTHPLLLHGRPHPCRPHCCLQRGERTRMERGADCGLHQRGCAARLTHI